MALKFAPLLRTSDAKPPYHDSESATILTYRIHFYVNYVMKIYAKMSQIQMEWNNKWKIRIQIFSKIKTKLIYDRHFDNATHP